MTKAKRTDEIAELLRRAVEAGVTHITLEDTAAPDDTEPWWHWDVYVGDPHRWHHIPKPWTLRVYWLGNREGQNSNPNRWLRSRWFNGFPWFFGVDTWIVSSYGHAEDMGCGYNSPDEAFPAIESLRSAVTTLECPNNDLGEEKVVCGCGECSVKDCEFFAVSAGEAPYPPK